MHFTEILLQNDCYKLGEYELALKQTFLRLDEIMSMPNARLEMEAFSGKQLLNRIKSRIINPVGNFGSTALVCLITPT